MALFNAFKFKNFLHQIAILKPYFLKGPGQRLHEVPVLLVKAVKEVLKGLWILIS
jgi:hypothetical protein